MKAEYNKDLQTFNKALSDKIAQLETSISDVEEKTEPATGTTAGVVLQGVAVADATDDTDVVAQLNALLASLRDAGIIAT